MSHRAFDGYTSPKTANGVDGYDTVIRGQSALGTGTLGGNLVLTSGSGTVRDGYVKIGSYSNERVVVGPDSVIVTGAVIDDVVLSGVTLDKVFDITFDGYEVTPTITQENMQVNGADGYDMLIKAQSSLIEPGSGGNLSLNGGDGYSGGGNVSIVPGDGYDDGGNLFLNGGDGYNGGNIFLTSGDGYNGDGNNRDGYISLLSGGFEAARVLPNKFFLSSSQKIKLDNVGTTPFTVPDGYFTMMVSTASLAITINLPNSPEVGDLYQIKDSTGNASTNNITVQSLGGTYNIDGNATYTISTNYSTAMFVFNGVQWSVL